MIQLRMTSSPAKKLAFDSELVTLSRLLVRTITIGGRVNWKTPKMERQVSFLLQNFRNGMSVFVVLVSYINEAWQAIFHLYILLFYRVKPV